MSCLICNRISMIGEGKNKYLVKELQTGYVVVGDSQYQKGYTLFLSKTHARELHELSKKQRTLFLEQMALVAEAVYKSFKPNKLNYELLGNTDEHLHWHFFPRYTTDADPTMPVWNVPSRIRNAKKYEATLEQIEQAKNKLLKYL